MSGRKDSRFVGNGHVSGVSVGPELFAFDDSIACFSFMLHLLEDLSYRSG